MSECDHVWGIEGIGPEARPGLCLHCGVRWVGRPLPLPPKWESNEQTLEELMVLLHEAFPYVDSAARRHEDGRGIQLRDRIRSFQDAWSRMLTERAANAEADVKRWMSRCTELVHQWLDEKERADKAEAEVSKERADRHIAERDLHEIRNQWLDLKEENARLQREIETAQAAAKEYRTQRDENAERARPTFEKKDLYEKLLREAYPLLGTSDEATSFARHLDFILGER